MHDLNEHTNAPLKPHQHNDSLTHPPAHARHTRTTVAPARANISSIDDKIARAKHAAPPLPDQAEDRNRDVAESARLISICVALSRITGFARTWCMAFALGATFLSSSYQVANNLPNQLYELVMGGMLVTAFLPVYVSVKKHLGKEAANRYSSNLLTLVVLLLGIISIVCMIFPQAIIYTQSFMSDQAEMGTAVMLFQFFAIQTVFYGASTIFSGLLNANREYLWSSAAPIFNNLIVIATFIAYAVVAPMNAQLALYIIAIGNPLGVLVQVVVQMPALKAQGISLRPRIDFKDPYLRETLSLGIPALGITIFTFITVSVMNAASYVFADNGPSVIAYARLWYTLPYSFLAIPITTAMFTELSEMQSEGNMQGVRAGIASGMRQIIFLLIPFALYLVVFSKELVTLYHTGAFTADRIDQIAGFLVSLAIALPFFGVSTYLQKIFSSIRRMGTYALFNALASILQVVLTLLWAWQYEHGLPIPIESIGIASALFYLALDIMSFIYLRVKIGDVGIGAIVRSALKGLFLGCLGAGIGWLVLYGLNMLFVDATQSIASALVCILVGGSASLLVTFGLALKLKCTEAALVASFVHAITRRFKRG